jgi:ABC-type Fe3+-hydroxamate transport system substrate-binding protein
MRVISLVPSWTETLIEAGVQVCGRTRFCIHPQEKVSTIPAVGGTKEIDWEKVASLKPDLVLFDKEENPKKFSEECPFPWIATHVVDLNSAHEETKMLAAELKNQKLREQTELWEQVLQQAPRKWSFEQIPGEIKKLQTLSGSSKKGRKIIYVIWKKPWMAAHQSTYIGSVLKHLGAPLADLQSPEPYPHLKEELMRENYILFSSEPYPFLKKENELAAGGFTGSIVDGESYSWFGIRGLNFLLQARRKS